jgi:hypothetical protein
MKYGFADIKNARAQILLILGIALCLASYVNFFLSYKNMIGTDFYQFWLLGQAIHEPETGNIYSTEERIRLGTLYYETARSIVEKTQVPSRQFEAAMKRKTLSGYSTPFLYTFFGMISTGNYEIDFTFYRILIYIIYAAVLFGLAVFFKLSIFESFLLFPLLTCHFIPFISENQVLNVNIIQLGLLAVFMCCYHRDRSVFRIFSGIILGVLIAFKPNVSLPIFLFLFGILVDKNFHIFKQIIIGILGGSIISIGVSWLWTSNWTIWLNWLGSMNELFSDIQLTFSQGNYSLFIFLEEFFGKMTAQIVSVCLILIGLILIWITRYQQAPNQNENIFFERDIARLGIGFAFSLLTAGLTWVHYYMLLVPFILFIFRRSYLMMNSFRFLGIFVFLLFFSLMPNVKILGLNSIGVQVIIGSLLFIVLLYQELQRSISCQPASAD